MCVTAFKHFTDCSQQKYYAHLKAAEEGRSTPVLDCRMSNGKAPSIADDVNNFCVYLYEFVAEPLAETDDKDAVQERRGTNFVRLIGPSTGLGGRTPDFFRPTVDDVWRGVCVCLCVSRDRAWIVYHKSGGPDLDVNPVA
jgi:hypothetical protein